MKRPLIPVALLYLIGILLAHWLVPLSILFPLAFLLLLVAFCRPRARLCLLAPLIVLLGWINMERHTAVVSPQDLRLLVPEPALVSVRGIIRDTPQRRLRIAKNKEIETTTAQIEVTAIHVGENPSQSAIGRIVTTTQGLLPESFFAGQTVEILGEIGPPEPPVAEGLFDYPAYLHNLGIYHQLRVKATNDWKIISSPAQPPPADRFCAWARKTLARGLPIEDETLRLEWALTLGWKAAMTDEVSEPFIKAATYHIFAVDGLRIAIISGILIGLLRVLGVPRGWCGVLAIPLIFFYAQMTGWPASALRAIVMISVVFIGWMLNRPRDLLNSLAAAALIILVLDPRQLYQSGFQLSLFVVLCIILILPFFEKLGQRLLRVDPLLPDELRPPWQQALRTAAFRVTELFLTSVAAWLGSIPLVAYYFHILTPTSGPANVLAVPLCALVLICNLSSLMFGAWLPFISTLFNHAGWFLMKCIQVTSHWSANWPGAWFYVPMPGLFTIAVYYALLVAMFTGWLFRKQWRAWKITGAALLIAVWLVQWLHQLPVTRLTVLPLHGGHAVYLHPPAFAPDWLIDCGDESETDFVTKPFLRAQGVNRLSHFILTHGEISYSGGAQLTVDLFHPRNIYTSAIDFRSPTYKEFQRTNHLKSEWRWFLKCGDHFGPWTVLHPAADDHFPKAEDNTIVLRGEIDGTRILLLSDLGRAGQLALLERTNDLHADLVIAGIPADAEPLSETLLDTIQPRAIIIADTQQPAMRKASWKLRHRLALRNIPILYQSDTAAVTIEFRPDHWTLRAMDGTQISSPP